MQTPSQPLVRQKRDGDQKRRQGEREETERRGEDRQGQKGKRKRRQTQKGRTGWRLQSGRTVASPPTSLKYPSTALQRQPDQNCPNKAQKQCSRSGQRTTPRTSTRRQSACRTSSATSARGPSKVSWRVLDMQKQWDLHWTRKKPNKSK